MHFLYLDESGVAGANDQSYLVLAGFSIFERHVYYLREQLNDVAARIAPDDPDRLEFHANPMLKGKGRWRGLVRGEANRRNTFREVLGCLTKESLRAIRVFAVAVHKPSLPDEDCFEYAFEQVCNRFDRYLARLYQYARPGPNSRARGVIVLDKSSYETRCQQMTRTFWSEGHRWGKIRNIVEVPMFVDSTSSRLIQLADCIAHAIFLYYERGDREFLNQIGGRFDQEGGMIHGLVHFTPWGDATCDCPACFVRRANRSS